MYNHQIVPDLNLLKVLSMTDNPSNYTNLRTKLLRPSVETERVLLSSLTLILWVVIALILFPSAVVFAQTTASPNESVSVQLTDEEQAWITDHPVIRFGIGESWTPWIYPKADGKHEGFEPDFISRINGLSGLNIEIIPGKWSELVEQAKKKEIDGLMMSSISEERREYFNFTDSYSAVYYGLATSPTQGKSIQNPSDLEGKILALQKSNKWVRKITEGIEGVQFVEADTQEEAFRLVIEGKADASMMSVTRYAKLRKTYHESLSLTYVFHEDLLESAYSVRKDWPELVSIINKTMVAISIKEKDALTFKWTGVALDKQTQKEVLTLTADEQAWLAQNHTIQTRVTDYPPFMIVKKNMEPTGIAIDYFNLIARRTGIKFNYNLSERPFADALKGMQNREGPDLMTIIARTAEREKTLLFSADYLSIPRVIFNRQEEGYIAGLEALYNKTVAVPRGMQIHDLLQARYPDVKLLLFNTDLEALQAVATGKADAYVGNLTLSSYLIQQRNLSALKVAAPAPFGDHTLSMGHRNDWPELTSILNKGLDSITDEEKARIQSKYVAIQFDHSRKIDDILKWTFIVGGTTAGIVLFFMFWTRSLARKVKLRTLELEKSNTILEVEVNERKKAELDLRASRDYLKNLTDSIGDVVFSIKLPERTIAWVNESFKIFGYSHEESIGKSPEFLYANKEEFLFLGEKMKKTVAEGANIVHAEVNFKRKNGEVFPADTLTTLFRVNGEVVSSTGILRDISERKAAEEKLLIYQKRLKALASQLTIAEEKERKRIATDLHDDVCQSLALLRVQMSSARKKASAPLLATQLDDISEVLLQTLQSTRNLMSDLSSPSMNEIGLSAAISELLEGFVKKRHNLETEFMDEIADLPRNMLEDNVRAILYRNVRELLTNIIKHAQATKVSVHIKQVDSLVLLTVRDDGIGFDPGELSRNNGQQGGFGLFSIKERMSDMNGTFEVVSEPGKGCKALLTVPVAAGLEHTAVNETTVCQ